MIMTMLEWEQEMKFGTWSVSGLGNQLPAALLFNRDRVGHIKLYWV